MSAAELAGWSLLWRCAVVALIWGGTNPWIKRGAEAAAAAAATTGKDGERRGRGGAAADRSGVVAWLTRFMALVAATFANWRFVLPFALNQAGSVGFNFLLGAAPISLAGPITNALTSVVTAVVAGWLGEEQQVWNVRTVVGSALVLGGIALCMSNE